MSAEITDYDDGILTIRIRGALTQPELAAAQKRAAEIIQQVGTIRLLVLTENFEGWRRGGDWGDLSFQMDHDHHIDKLAIVGEKRWEDLALIFVSKGFRAFPIEYFEPAQLTEARAWLTE